MTLLQHSTVFAAVDSSKFTERVAKNFGSVEGLTPLTISTPSGNNLHYNYNPHCNCRDCPLLELNNIKVQSKAW